MIYLHKPEFTGNGMDLYDKRELTAVTHVVMDDKANVKAHVSVHVRIATTTTK